MWSSVSAEMMNSSATPLAIAYRSSQPRELDAALITREDSKGGNSESNTRRCSETEAVKCPLQFASLAASARRSGASGSRVHGQTAGSSAGHPAHDQTTHPDDATDAAVLPSAEGLPTPVNSRSGLSARGVRPSTQTSDCVKGSCDGSSVNDSLFFCSRDGSATSHHSCSNNSLSQPPPPSTRVTASARAGDVAGSDATMTTAPAMACHTPVNIIAFFQASNTPELGHRSGAAGGSSSRSSNSYHSLHGDGDSSGDSGTHPSFPPCGHVSGADASRPHVAEGSTNATRHAALPISGAGRVNGWVSEAAAAVHATASQRSTTDASGVHVRSPHVVQHRNSTSDSPHKHLEPRSEEAMARGERQDASVEGMPRSRELPLNQSSNRVRRIALEKRNARARMASHAIDLRPVAAPLMGSPQQSPSSPKAAPRPLCHGSFTEQSMHAEATGGTHSPASLRDRCLPGTAAADTSQSSSRQHSFLGAMPTVLAHFLPRSSADMCTGTSSPGVTPSLAAAFTPAAEEDEGEGHLTVEGVVGAQTHLSGRAPAALAKERASEHSTDMLSVPITSPGITDDSPSFRSRANFDSERGRFSVSPSVAGGAAAATEDAGAQPSRLSSGAALTASRAQLSTDAASAAAPVRATEWRIATSTLSPVWGVDIDTSSDEGDGSAGAAVMSPPLPQGVRSGNDSFLCDTLAVAGQSSRCPGAADLPPPELNSLAAHSAERKRRRHAFRDPVRAFSLTYESLAIHRQPQSPINDAARISSQQSRSQRSRAAPATVTAGAAAAAAAASTRTATGPTPASRTGNVPTSTSSQKGVETLSPHSSASPSHMSVKEDCLGVAAPGTGSRPRARVPHYQAMPLLVPLTPRSQQDLSPPSRTGSLDSNGGPTFKRPPSVASSTAGAQEKGAAAVDGHEGESRGGCDARETVVLPVAQVDNAEGDDGRDPPQHHQATPQDPADEAVRVKHEGALEMPSHPSPIPVTADAGMPLLVPLALRRRGSGGAAGEASHVSSAASSLASSRAGLYLLPNVPRRGISGSLWQGDV